MLKNNIIDSANKLFNSKLNHKSINFLEDKLTPKNIEEAYTIQNELKNNYLSLKKNICIGKKVGCTNEEAQIQLGINEPFYGNLFSNYSSSNYCKLKSTNFSKPYIEPEISFLIKNDINISYAPFNISHANDLFAGIVCSIEIVDFRFDKPINKIGIKNIIATNGASDFWIKGNKIFKLNEVDISNIFVSIFINDDLIVKGNTSKVLGNPINSAIWVLNKLCKRGEIMLKDQFISTGSCTEAVKLEKNNKIKAEFGSLESIEFDYI